MLKPLLNSSNVSFTDHVKLMFLHNHTELHKLYWFMISFKTKQF